LQRGRVCESGAVQLAVGEADLASQAYREEGQQEGNEEAVMSLSTEYKVYHEVCLRILIEQGILNIRREIDRILEGDVWRRTGI
jgi:hypothetical protein